MIDLTLDSDDSEDEATTSSSNKIGVYSICVYVCVHMHVCVFVLVHACMYTSII